MSNSLLLSTSGISSLSLFFFLRRLHTLHVNVLRLIRILVIHVIFSSSSSNLACFFAAANESTRKRVIFYTLAEYLMLIVASGLQVIYIRQLFSKSVGYNRV